MKFADISPFHIQTGQRGVRRRSGVTMVESIIVIVVLGTMTSIALPRVSKDMQQRRVISASTAVNAQIPQAFSLAARQRKPVTLTYDAASGELRIADRSQSDSIYSRRALRATSEYMLDSVTMTPSAVQVFPNGVSSSAFTIRLVNGSFVRQVTVSRTGFSRITTH